MLSKNVQRQLNTLIDEIVHPHCQTYPALYFLDGLLHALVEQNPNASLRKFIRYNVPKIIRACEQCMRK